MSEYTEEEKLIPADEPALFLTTQTTLPMLTTIMAGFSLAVLAIAKDLSGSAWLSVNLFSMPLTAMDLVFALLGLSALFFVAATEACIKSQAWDYFSLSKERRDFYRLEKKDWYKTKCSNKSKNWHKWAVILFHLGFSSLMLGFALLFWSVSPLTSILVGLLGPGYIFYYILRFYDPDKFN